MLRGVIFRVGKNKARAGFEPARDGFANRCLSQLGYRAKKESSNFNHLSIDESFLYVKPVDELGTRSKMVGIDLKKWGYYTAPYENCLVPPLELFI